MTEGFRSSLMGFCKEDVLRYIETLSAGFAQELAEKDKELEALRRKNDELRRTIQNLKADLRATNERARNAPSGQKRPECAQKTL